MRKQKKFHPILLDEWFPLVMTLTDAQQAQLLRVFLKYPEITEDDVKGLTLWPFFDQQLEIQANTYKDKCEKARESINARYAKKQEETPAPEKESTQTETVEGGAEKVECDIQTPYKKIKDEWNAICGAAGLPTVYDIKYYKRRQIANKFWCECIFSSFKRGETISEDLMLNQVKSFFTVITKSDWLSGRKTKDFQASFDWALQPDNFQKIIEGNYANREN